MRNFSSKLNKIPFFQFFRKIKRNVFPGHNVTLSAKVVFFPLFMIYFLYRKNTTYWKIVWKLPMKNVPFPPYFFFFFYALYGKWQKYHQNSPKVLEFFYVTCRCTRASLGDIFLQIVSRKKYFLKKYQKNHFFQFWWNGGHIPYDDWKTCFPQHKPCGFRYKTLIICIFYSV